MRWMPWISREHHNDVIAAKDALIRSLEVQNAVLAEKLAEPVKVTVDFPKEALEALTSKSSNQVEKEEVTPRHPKKKALPEIDFSMLDERNPVQIAALAMEEFGSIPRPEILARWYNMVRMQCIHGRKKRRAQADQTGQVATLVVRPQDIPPGPVTNASPHPDVPEPILELIAAAERGQ